MTPDIAAERRDRFGNPIDPKVGYARGKVITDEVAESLRQRHAFSILRERYRRLGDAGVFNLTGLIRAFPFEAGDHDAMKSYVHFHARSDGELERAALARMGGDPARHDGFLSTRVSAGMLAIMLALIEPGRRVLSLVADDRSHPSVKQAVEIARGEFVEFTDIDGFDAAIARGPAPQMIVLTMISPSKKHLPREVALRAIAAGRAAGALVLLDDAHMAARISLYDPTPGLAFDGVDLSIWSLDKHVPGPRSGFVAGRKDLIRQVRARANALGVEAQLGQVIAGINAIAAFDPEPIREASRMAGRLLTALADETEGRVYLAGAGIAVGGEDFLDLALRRARKNRTELVPIEAVAFASMKVLESHGGVMIPAVGMPGAACTFRIMTYPDGNRMGEPALLDAYRSSVDQLAGVLDDVEAVRTALMGEGAAGP